MKKQWITPEGEYYKHIEHMINQYHLLIGGASRSGKSVLLNTIIHTALLKSPATLEFMLIDPKRVELSDYKSLPHTIGYASEHSDIIKLLQSAIDTMERRYKEMSRKKVKVYDGKHLYIIFDEFGDLMTTSKKQVEPLIVRLAQLGAAARIHLILATQNPSRQTITAGIKVNVVSSVALRCREALESRMIIGSKGAELLPKHGHGYYYTPDHLKPQLVPIPLTSDEAIKTRVEWWMNQTRQPKFKNIFSIFTRF